MKFPVVSACLLCGSFLAESSKAQPPQPALGPQRAGKSAGQVLEEGKQAQRAGDLPRAIQKFEDAKRLAVEAGDTKVGASAASRQAQVIQSSINVERAPRVQAGATVADAVKNYEFVIANGAAQEKTLARNNLGTLLLQQGKSAEAVQVLEGMDFSSIQQSSRFIAYYNLGRAKEANNARAGALASYQEAIRFDPSYVPAIEGAFRILLESTPPNVKVMANLATNLILRGEAQIADPELRQALLRSAREPDAQYLFAARLMYYISTSMTPWAFEKSEKPFLSQLTERGPALAPAVQEVSRSFSADMPIMFDASKVRDLFPSWTKPPWGVRPFALLLRKVGEFYASSAGGQPTEQTQKALACYCASWMLDERDTEPALAIASLLRERKERLPSAKELTDRFVAAVFDVKSGLYRFGMPERTEDYVNLLRLHLILASIFEDRGMWTGPDPQSVIFQLSRAVELEKELRRRTADYTPSPGLHERLGAALEHTGAEGRVWEAYVQAAESFARAGNAARARTALGKAQSRSIVLSDDQKQRLARLEESIKQVESLP
jgi:tetratricopeptide (TPR) repeat protein